MTGKDHEAEALRRLFQAVPNKAAFARDHNVPGGPSMLSQHLSGNRPLSFEAAVAYARGFGVPLATISERCAEMARAAAALAVGGAAGGNAPTPVPTRDLAAPTLAAALEVVGMALAREMPERTRAEVAEAMSAWARYAGREIYRSNVAALLEGDGANRTGTDG